MAFCDLWYRKGYFTRPCQKGHLDHPFPAWPHYAIRPRRCVLRDSAPKWVLRNQAVRNGEFYASMFLKRRLRDQVQNGHFTRPGTKRKSPRSDPNRFTRPGSERASNALIPHNGLLLHKVPECVSHRDAQRREAVSRKVHRNIPRNYATRTKNL